MEKYICGHTKVEMAACASSDFGEKTIEPAGHMFRPWCGHRCTFPWLAASCRSPFV